MQARQTLSRTSLLVMALALTGSVLSGCTKSKEQKSLVGPDAYVEKTAFEGKTFHYVRGVEESDSENSVFAVPGFSNDFGTVNVRITENELQLLQAFDPLRRDATQTIVASYPIKDHFDIIREVNDFGEATHKIVENKEKPWSQRAYMRVDWANPSNSLSQLGTADLGESIRAENVVLAAAPEIRKDGHVSWLTEFSGVPEYYGPVSRIYVRTHLMPVKPTDFEKLNYREKDFKRFGYFYTQQNFEDPEKGFLDSMNESNTYANVHNVCEPGRKSAAGKPLSCSTNKIVWNLTKEFPGKYLEVTRQAVKEWNQTFKEALGRTDDVVVLDESLAVDIIDPRYNTIAHYAPKASGGLLGVAQEVVNPITGETVASRATVYEDGIRGTLGWVDDVINMILQDPEMRDIFLATEQERKERLKHLILDSDSSAISALHADGGASRQGGGHLSAAVTRIAQNKMATGRTASNRSARSLRAQDMKREFAKLVSEPASLSVARKRSLMLKAPQFYATAELSKIGGVLASYDQVFGRSAVRKATASASTSTANLPDMNGLESLHQVGDDARAERARVLLQAERGIHGTELVEEAALRYIIKILASSRNISDFKSQVHAIKAEIDRMTFYTTLLHEMGHTFGLRHNFAASADEKHYSDRYFDIKKRVERGEKTVTAADYEPYMFSSIMDYGGDFYSQLGGIGSYDKAAIKYGYNRSIDRETDAVVEAGFKFCTDHEADESILCRRFDKGRNVSEVTLNLIERYRLNWALSHSRRDRANFDSIARSYPRRAMKNYFIPIRQVMDEYLFAMISAKEVPAGKDQCDMEYWRKSVDAGEIVNVCDYFEAEQNGVDATDVATFPQGLFKLEGTGENAKMVPRKEMTELLPYGLADLVSANQLALDFFADVLGSTEPGRFVALVTSRKSGMLLERLPSKGTVEEALAEYVSENEDKVEFMTTALQATSAEDLVKKLMSFTGEIKAGRYGKPFKSEPDESGVFAKQSSIGAFWDKYVAMVALGLKDIGVRKYARHSMSGNAYVFPQTKAVVSEFFKTLITEQGRLSSAVLKTARGEITGKVAGSFDRETQAIATVTALTDFVSEGDRSIVDKLRVCSSGEQGCQAAFDQKSLEFMSASGQERYRAVQTMANDSIAFEMVAAAATLDKERRVLVEKVQKASDSIADALMKLSEAEESRSQLSAALLGAELGADEAVARNRGGETARANSENVLTSEAQKARQAKILKLVASDIESDASAWTLTKLLTEQASQAGLFTAFKLSTAINGRFQASFAVLQEMISATDPAQQCGDLGLEGIGEKEPSAPRLPPAATLNGSADLRNARLRDSLISSLAIGDRRNAANSEAEREKACKPVVEARKPIIKLANKVLSFSGVFSEIAGLTVDTKLSPLWMKRKTDELARAEGNIQFIRTVSKAVGLE